MLKESVGKNLEVRVTDRLHAKIYVMDGKVAITGSVNLTERGMYVWKLRTRLHQA